jgi:hypothetical protein
MTDRAPIDAKVVARILRRAGDLERAGEMHDEGATIAEASLIAAAEEVGLSVDAVRRSIAVERLGPVPEGRAGDRIVGPSQVYVDGEVDVPAGDALARVDSWLVDGHHLRRDTLRSGHGEWSKRSGLFGATVRTVRHATGEGKLGDFERVNATACDTGIGSSVVRITIDRTTGRRLAGGGGMVLAVGGVTGVALGAVVVATPVALLAMPAAIVAGVGVALTGRKRARTTEREIGRLLEAVRAGDDPTRLSVDVVRRATGKATAAGSSALRTIGKLAPPPPPRPPVPPRLRLGRQVPPAGSAEDPAGTK